MKKHLLLFFLVGICGIPITTKAQKLEIGGSVGLVQYKGDLQPSYKFYSGNPGGGLFVRYNAFPAISVKASGMAGWISGKDTRVKAPLHRYREYEFNSFIYEYGGQLEFNFLDFRSTRALRKSEGTPYLFVGYNLFSLPQIKYRFLTSSNPKSYAEQVSQPVSANSLPFGVGFKKVWKSSWNLGFEFGARKLFTDELDKFGYRTNNDGVYGPNRAASIDSPELLIQKTAVPNNHLKDMYFYANFYISYVFYKVHCPNPR